MGMTFAVQRHSPVLTSFLWLAAEAERERDFSIMQGPVLSSGFRATVCTRLQTQSCPAFLCSQESTNESALEKRVHCPIGQLQFSRSRRQRSWPLCNGRDWRWDKHHELLPGTMTFTTSPSSGLACFWSSALRPQQVSSVCKT